MARIHRLDAGLVNKIAAGEVIERPASVVKELLENSLDAHARRIDVLIQRGGLDQIRIVDDGEGIECDDLPLAVSSHATSKLQQADDLFRVSTLGFRGEALASIAEISHLRIRSRPATSPAGAELRVEGGVHQPIVPCAAAPGTSVDVSNLFFNTPVRRKFLRSTSTEMGHLTEAFTRLALVHADVHMTLVHDDRTLFDLPPSESWQSRIRALCGDEIADALIPIQRQEGAVYLHGFAANPSVSRGSNRTQYFFVNQRHIRDRSLSHALSEAYRGLLMTGRFPIAFLQIELPADQVDVNVHPTKAEVRFVDGGSLYSLVLGSLRSEFLRCDLTARGRLTPGVGGSTEFAEPAPEHADEARRSEINAWARPVPAAFPWTDPRAGELQPTEPRPATSSYGSFRSGSTVPAFRPFDSGPPPPPAVATERPFDPSTATLPAAASPTVPAMQICNRYLVTESDQGLMVIDQHALHERILYEELKQKVGDGDLEAQRLLVPEPVELSPADAGMILEHRDVLLELGLEVEPFSGNTLIVTSYPAMLANLSPAEILRKIAEQLAADAKKLDRRMLLDELLHMIACKAAIKAGDRLTPQEISSLIDLRHLVHDAHHCPHGRPTTLVFSREELDRQFRRT